MKQSILFEQGKLYVVELPEGQPCYSECAPPCLSCVNDHKEIYKAALANKVEVKNPEVLGMLSNSFIRKDGETLPLPADLTFDKETGMLKRIMENKLYTHIVYKGGNSFVGFSMPDQIAFSKTGENWGERYNDAVKSAIESALDLSNNNSEMYIMPLARRNGVWVYKIGSCIKELEIGDTFPLPDGIIVEEETKTIKVDKCGVLSMNCPYPECNCSETVKYATLKRIEPEKSIARRLLDETPQEIRDRLRVDANAYLRAKRELIEPEKPEETQEEVIKKIAIEFAQYIDRDSWEIEFREQKTLSWYEHYDHFTIQRKKS